MKRWLKEPLFHFLLIGFAVFGLNAVFASRKEGGRASARDIVVTQGRIQSLEETFRRQWSRPRGPSTYVPAPCRNIGARIAGTPFRQPRMTDGGLTTRAAPNGVRDYGPARSSASRIGCALNAIQRSIGPRARSALSGCSVPKVARCDIAGRIASPLFYRQGYTDPLDYQQAARFLAWAFAHGLAAHWTCAR